MHSPRPRCDSGESGAGSGGEHRRGSLFDLAMLLRSGSLLGGGLFPPKKASSVSRKQAVTYEFGMSDEEKRETDEFLGRDDDDDTNRPLPRDRILQKIREKKEVMGKLRCQPWNMRRKRRTLKLAQKYLEKHESRVSKSHLYKEELNRKWNKFSRWFSNISIYLIPWENKIKTIESHFGSVVSSYFTFLRWIFWVNFMITCLMTVFIVIPECLGGGASEENLINNTRKFLSDREYESADHLQTLWDFKGYLAVTPLFYGFYSNQKYVSETFRYQLPLAYFLVNLCVLGYSFFAVLRKMAANARMSKLASGKTEQYVFCWKLFTGWDFTIGNGETASNTVMATVNKLRESIAEYRVKLRTKFICLRFLLRILANVLILGLQAMSAWVIFTVVERSKNLHKMRNVGTFRHNEVPIVVSFITLVFPNLFEVIGSMERYHPRTALRLQLGRVLILYVLNYYTLIFALFTKMADQQKMLDLMRLNMSREEIGDTFDTGGYSNYPENMMMMMKYVGKPPNLKTLEKNPNLEEKQQYQSKTTRKKRNNLLLKQLLLFFKKNPNFGQSTTTSKPLLEKLLTSYSTHSLPPTYSAVSSRNPRKQYSLREELPTVTTWQEVSTVDSWGEPATGTLQKEGFQFDTHTQRSVTEPESGKTTKRDIGSTKQQTTAEDSTVPPWMKSLPPLQPLPISPTSVSPTTSTTSSWWDTEVTASPNDTTVGVILLNSSHPLGPEFEKTETTTLPLVEISSTVEAFWRENVSDSEIEKLPAGEIVPRLPKNYTKPATQFIQKKAGGKFRKAVYYPPAVKEEKQRKGEPRYDRLKEDLAAEGYTLCWENMIGQEISKIITTDLVMNIAAIIVVDFMRGLWVRYCSIWWCWNLETTFPEYGEFKVAENVLHIINNQGMIWLGMFFAPLLPAMNNMKLIVLMYIRAWAVMTCNVPAQQIFRASRSSNFYLMLLLLMLFLCTLPVGYVIAARTPSNGCGPFSGKNKFYHILTDKLAENLSPTTMAKLDYIASPGVVIPVLVLLVLVIYFLVSLVRGLKESNRDLSKQLVHERTDEKRKIYQLAGGGKDSVAQGDHQLDMPNTTHVDLRFYPPKEQARREPWRKRQPLLHDETEPMLSALQPEYSDDEDMVEDQRDNVSVNTNLTDTSRMNTNISGVLGATAMALLPPITARSKSPSRKHSGASKLPLKTLQEESAQESGAASDADTLSVMSRSEGNLDRVPSPMPQRTYLQTQSAPGIAKSIEYTQLVECTTDQTEESELPLTTDDERQTAIDPIDSARSWPTPRTPEGIRAYLLEEGGAARTPTPLFPSPSTVLTPRSPDGSDVLSGRASDRTFYDNLRSPMSPLSVDLSISSPENQTCPETTSFQFTPTDLQKMLTPTAGPAGILSAPAGLLSGISSSLKRPFQAISDWTSREPAPRESSDFPMQQLDYVTATDDTEMTNLDTDSANEPQEEAAKVVEPIVEPVKVVETQIEPSPTREQEEESEGWTTDDNQDNDSGAEASTEEAKGIPVKWESRGKPVNTTFSPWPSPEEVKKVQLKTFDKKAAPHYLAGKKPSKRMQMSEAPSSSDSSSVFVPPPAKLSESFCLGDKPPKPQSTPVQPSPSPRHKPLERQSRPSAKSSPIKRVTVSISPSPSRITSRTSSPQDSAQRQDKDKEEDTQSVTSNLSTSVRMETDV